MTGHRDGVHRDPIDPLPGRGDRRERTARAAVLEHATGEHRRHFPTLVHAGAPLGRATVVPAEHGGDHALRTDVLGALLWRRRHEAPLVWLTRGGSLAWQDADAAWFAAWREPVPRGDPTRMARPVDGRDPHLETDPRPSAHPMSAGVRRGPARTGAAG